MFRTIVYALLIALVFRTVFFQPFSIPSGSMKPTLLIGDYLFVSKYSYGFSRYALPYGNLLPRETFGGRLFGATPERGDVIVFRNPTDENEDYIKRLVGLPGDRVAVRAGVLFLNGDPVKLDRVPSFIEPKMRSSLANQKCVTGRNLFELRVPEEERAIAQNADNCLKVQFKETLPNDTVHFVLNATENNKLDNVTEITVPEGHYFFMGDNRDNSVDSRQPRSLRGIGFVPAENLIGRAEMILLSADGPYWEIWNWRADRFFKSID
ncbi:MAG: signal peptidase I [Pseudomonadota bacterium]